MAASAQVLAKDRRAGWLFWFLFFDVETKIAAVGNRGGAVRSSLTDVTEVKVV